MTKTKKSIDCLFIGHNEMNFREYLDIISSMGKKSGAYRDLNLNFIGFENSPSSISDVYNYFMAASGLQDNLDKPLSTENTFSTTIPYLGTYLSRRGYSFDYVMSFQDNKAELAEMLHQNDYLTIAIPTTLYISVFPILEIIQFIRQYSQKSKIVLGGPFVATQVRTQAAESIQYLFSSIDADVYINSSQGEATLINIISTIKNNTSLCNVNNIIYREKNAYNATHLVAENNVLDENTIDWSLFADRIGGIAATRTSISCPFSCSYCGFPQHAGKYQTASVEAIERELNSLAEIGRVKCINFIDDTFNIPPKRFKELMKLMIKNKYEFKWNCNFRCQFADREMVELMKESGCEGAFLGIESGSQKILNNMNKNATIEQYQRGISLLKEYKILTYGSFIVGFPGETYDSIQETKNFIEEYKPDFFRTQLWYCDPFTPIWKEKDKYQIKNSQFEWSHETMDAHTAADWVDDIFLSIKNSIWIPQYNFEFFGIFNLMQRNRSIDWIKSFVTIFNDGVKEKLGYQNQDNVSPSIINRFKDIFD